MTQIACLQQVHSTADNGVVAPFTTAHLSQRPTPTKPVLVSLQLPRSKEGMCRAPRRGPRQHACAPHRSMEAGHSTALGTAAQAGLPAPLRQLQPLCESRPVSRLVPSQATLWSKGCDITAGTARLLPG